MVPFPWFAGAKRTILWHVSLLHLDKRQCLGAETMDINDHTATSAAGRQGTLALALAVSIALAASSTGCGGDDEPPPCSPTLPQISISSVGFLVLPVATAGSTTNGGINVLNSGCTDLVFTDIVWNGAAGLSVVIPDERTLAPSAAMNISIVFSPESRGVISGRLQLRSNAEDFPIAEVEVIGPGSASPRPQGPDLLLLETTAKVVSLSVADNPDVTGIAFVRYINVGLSPVGIRNFEILDSDGGVFTINAGPDLPTPTPAAPFFLGPNALHLVEVLYTGSGGNAGMFQLTAFDRANPDAPATLYRVALVAP